MTHMQPCLACRQVDDHQVASNFEVHGIRYTLLVCTRCKSLFYDPLPNPNYSEHTAAEEAIRDYVELNAGVDILVGFVLSVLQGRKPGRLLDMGCGFGFAADIARRLLGWEVKGVEPSRYGRVGGEALGLEIIQEIIHPNHPLAREQFDAILATEVLEHISDPASFLRLLHRMLRRGGILALTVPCASAALSSSISKSQRLAVLSPGFHTVLFSVEGLTCALQGAGFRHVHAVPRDVSIIALASDIEQLEFCEAPSALEGSIDYARLVIDTAPENTSLRAGLLFRLFRWLVELGRYEEADRLVLQLDRLLTKPDLASTYKEFLGKHRAFVAAGHFYRAMLELNHRARYHIAANLFRVAHDFCRIKLRVAPSLSAVESNLIWLAKFHEGLALKFADREDEAGTIFQSMLEAKPDDLFPAVPESLITRVEEQLGFRH